MRQQLAEKMQQKSIKSLSSRGFALADLLVGAALTTAVVAVAGFGVSSMIGSSNASNARSQSRVEMNRSLDFITAEIKKSKGLIPDVNATTLTPALTIPSRFATTKSSIIDGTATNVLMIDINTPATGTSRPPVIYFVGTPKSGLWKGPRVLYRWGPKFNASGGYDNADAPTGWTSEALVDNIAASTATAPTCTSGTMNGDSGFYTCVDSAGKSAQILQNGKINKLVGSAETYRLSMNTGTRQTTVVQPTPTIAAGAASASIAPPFTIVNGGVDVPKASSITVQTIAGKGYPDETSLRVAVKPIGTTFTDAILGAGTLQADARYATSKTYSIPAGSTISMAGCSNGTGSMTGSFKDYPSSATYKIEYCPTSTNSSHQGTTVHTLKNGDTIPTVAGASGQDSLATILTKAGMASTSGKVVANSNQIIYLFELATTQKTHEYYDLQDIVVKVTFN
jgi:hypothetical protein